MATVQQAEHEARQLLDACLVDPGRIHHQQVDPYFLARNLGITVQTVPLPADVSGNISSLIVTGHQ